MSCCAKFSKIFLIVLNVVAIVLGLALLAALLYAQLELNITVYFDMSPYDVSSYIMYAMYGLIGLLVAVAIFGILVACCEKKLMTLCYLCFATIIFIVMTLVLIAFVALLVVFLLNLEDQLLDTLEKDFVDEDATDAQSLAWNLLQPQFKCCGVGSYQDWLNTKWFREVGEIAVPYARNWTVFGCQGIEKIISLSSIIDKSYDLDSLTPDFYYECYGIDSSTFDFIGNPTPYTDGCKDKLDGLLTTVLSFCVALGLLLFLALLLIVICSCVLLCKKKDS